MTYEILVQHSTTSKGVLHTNLIDIFLWSSAQMRNIWLLAFALHVRSMIFARHCWTPASGMRDVAKFVVSGTSMLAIFAQFRKLEFRDTSILLVHETPHSPLINAIKLFQYHTTHSIHALLSGSIVDVKCLCASLVLLCVTATLVEKLLSCVSVKLHCRFGPYLWIWTNTWVPNSAEYVWSAHELIVMWHDASTVMLYRAPSIAPALRRMSRKHLRCGASSQVHTARQQPAVL